MKEYRIRKFWAIVIYIFAPLMIISFTYLLLMPFIDEDTSIEFLYFMGPVSLIMNVITILGFLDAVKMRLAITNSTFRYRSALSNKELKFDEVRGFRVSDNYIIVEPSTSKKKAIKISVYLESIDEIIGWLSDNFRDLQVENELKEEHDILTNDQFGINPEVRFRNLKVAKKVALVLNILSALVFAWTIFIKEPYEYCIIASIALPIISLLLVVLFKGLIRIDEKQGSKYPSVFISILLSSAGLLLRAILDFNILEYDHIWRPVAIISIGFLLIILFVTGEMKLSKIKDVFSMAALLIFFFAYGYGAIVTTNCIYDKSEPGNYQVQVLEKRINEGKKVTYYLKVTPWAIRTEPNEVEVSEQLYDQKEIGDSVNVIVKSGSLVVPWFTVSQ